MKNKKILVISDVDGCLTDGGMYYDSTGKVMKKFSAGDHEGYKSLRKNNIDVLFITADIVGFEITEKRMKDMSNAQIDIVKEVNRLGFVEQYRSKYDIVVLFGDGLGDAFVRLKNGCDLFICPQQSINEVKRVADIVTDKKGGDQAFLDMTSRLLQYLYERDYIENIKHIYE